MAMVRQTYGATADASTASWVGIAPYLTYKLNSALTEWPCGLKFPGQQRQRAWAPPATSRVCHNVRFGPPPAFVGNF